MLEDPNTSRLLTNPQISATPLLPKRSQARRTKPVLRNLKEQFVTLAPVFWSSRPMIMAGALIFFCFLTGPFGTLYSMPLAVRFVFWSLVVLSSLVSAWASRSILLTLCADRLCTFRETMGVLMMTAFSMPMIVGLTAHASPSRMITFDFLCWMATMNFLISGAGWSLRFMVFADLIDGKDGEDEEETPPLMRRLPEEIHSPILRLEARNHKVLVTTEKGSADIRFRMTDAIKEMAPVEGILIHRSHWVALSVVHGMVWENSSKLLLVLRDGSVLPVSRSKQAEVLKQEIALLAHVPVNSCAA